MDFHRLLCNVASPYLVGLFQTCSRGGARLCQGSTVPNYLEDLGCVGAWCYDHKKRCWALSHSLSVLTGLPALLEQQDGLTGYCPDFIHPADGGAFLEAIENVLGGQAQGEIFHRLKLPNDSTIHAQSVLYTQSNQVETKIVVCATFDTTHECNADRRLRALGERSWHTRENGNDVQFDWNIATNRIKVGPTAARFLGLRASEYDHSFDSLFSLVHPSDRDRVSASLQTHLEGAKTVLELEARIRLAEGHYQWVLIHGNTLRDAQNNPVRFVGLVADVNERKQAELSLRESEEWLRGAIEGSFDAIQILRSVRNEVGAIVDFEILELNQRAEHLLGKKRSEIIGTQYFECNPNSRSSGDLEKFIRVVESRIAFEEERIQTVGSLGTRWIHIQAVPVGDGVSLTIADISSRKEDERVLVDSQRFIQKLATSLPVFVYVVDIQETAISYQNRDFMAHLGYPTGRFAKGLLSLCDLIHPDDYPARDAHRRAVADSKGDEVVETTCRLRTASDEWRWYQIRSVVFRRNDAGEAMEVIRTVHDVTAQKQSENELKERVKELRNAQQELHDRQSQLQALNTRLATLATTDGLTGLYNYRAFQDKLDEEVRRSKRYGSPISVVFVDVDDFKAYNDHFGHPAGDERLREFGMLLKAEARDSDFVARYGGEEFALILNNTTESDAAIFANRVVKRLNENVTDKRITASFGCAQLEMDDLNKEDLLHRADDCVYRAKRQGKNCVVVANRRLDSIGIIS